MLFPGIATHHFGDLRLLDAIHGPDLLLCVGARGVQLADFVSRRFRQLGDSTKTYMFRARERLEVVRPNTRGVFTAVVQMLPVGDGPMCSFVEVAVGAYNLALRSVVDLAVSLRSKAANPDKARCFKAAVLFFPALLQQSQRVASVDIVGWTAFNSLVPVVGCFRWFCGLSAATPAEAVGNIWALRQPIGAVFGGGSGYSFDVTTSWLGGGHAPGCATSAGAFPISKPNYSIGAVA